MGRKLMPHCLSKAGFFSHNEKRGSMASAFAAALIFLLLQTALAADKRDIHSEHRAANEGKRLAVGWGKLNYPPPVPGTYRLPVIRQLEDGRVLNHEAMEQSLAGYYRRGKITVLGFIYTSCPDVNGCPLATFVMHSLKKGLRDNPELIEQVQLISLSFDPSTDTPEVMKRYGQNYYGKRPEWFFLTTESHQELKPVLDDFGQFVIADPTGGEEGGATAFSHTLRVFLIDKRARVRNIYSPDFLHRDILLADIRTLLMESAQKP